MKVGELGFRGARPLQILKKQPKMKKLNSKIFEGRVLHQRLKPQKHRLTYKVFNLLIDLEELPRLSKKMTLFSHNSLNLFSFWDKDHGLGLDKPLISYIRETLIKSGLDCQDGPVRLLCYPRLFGYAFNPLSVYYCYDNLEVLKAVIYEVSNTFGERHSYLIKINSNTDKTMYHSCKKNFYVSPFLGMDAVYHFSITPPSKALTILIDERDQNGSILKASFSGRALFFNDGTLAKMFFKYPLMSFKVIAGIHWEAFKLWKKGLDIIARPSPPQTPITYVNSHPTEKKL
jgi:DUF1365 family protein